MHFKRLMLWIVSIVVVCSIFLEVALRTLGFGSPLLYRASNTGYEVRPNQSVTRIFKSISYNEYGLRNEEIEWSPREGTFRILCLGDSITYGGSQVSNDQTYPSLLQGLLKNSEVLNASAAGWSIFNEEKWLYENGLYGSRLLILEVGENDLFQEFSPASILDNNVSFPSRQPNTAIGEVVGRYVLPRVLKERQSVDPGASGSIVKVAVAAEVLAAVERIKTWSDSHGARMAILYVDPKSPSAEEGALSARDALFSWSKRNGVSLIRPRLDLSDGTVFRDQLHPNEFGNEIIASALAEEVNPLLKRP